MDRVWGVRDWGVYDYNWELFGSVFHEYVNKSLFCINDYRKGEQNTIDNTKTIRPVLMSAKGYHVVCSNSDSSRHRKKV